MKKSTDNKLIVFYLWVALGYFFLGFFSIVGKYPGRFFPVVFNNVWGVTYITVVNFILFEIAIPNVLKKRQLIIYNILLGIPVLFGFMLLYSYGGFTWKQLGLLVNIYTDLAQYATKESALSAQMAYGVGSVVVFGISRHIYNYATLRQSTQKLRIEKQEAELNYLKSQTNPHFLFNTLNNIYSLARDKNDQAPESILRLSKILRFMLYETGREYIALELELKIINDYIELEKLRYDETLWIDFSYDVEDMKQAIPPLLLVPLVENAFKHGVSETRNNAFIDIHLSINNRQLLFQIINSTETFAEEKPVKENIGLSNLRRQLEILFTEYQLTVQQNLSDFKLVLKINLASHV